MLKLLKHRSIQTIFVICLYFLIGHSLPILVHQFFYTISVLIKDLLVWMMPITIGLFIAHSVSSFNKKAPLFIVAIILFEFISNFTSVWYAYFSASFSSNFLPIFRVSNFSTDFNTIWKLPIAKPIWWSASNGVICGLFFGCFNALKTSPLLTKIITCGKYSIELILKKFFARLIPIFLLGFVAQTHQTGLLIHIFTHYAMLIVYLLSFLIIYLTFLFYLSSGFLLKDAVKSIKNLLPAGGIALTSGCSLSTIPWTIEGTRKNLQNPKFAEAVIPATTNIQQIGDCITNSFLCFLIFYDFYGVPPDFITWFYFSIIFVLARFTTAAILGGAIFIMLPIYESYLGFNEEMIAIILSLNIFLDPIITSVNVIANGALCRVFECVWMKVNFQKTKEV